MSRLCGKRSRGYFALQNSRNTGAIAYFNMDKDASETHIVTLTRIYDNANVNTLTVYLLKVLCNFRVQI